VYVKHVLERTAIYHYAARGSGLWYFTGKTLVVSDHFDLAQCTGHEPLFHRMNAQHGRGRGGPEGTLKLVFGILRRQGFESVILANHVDWAQHDMAESGKCQRSLYVTEIVNIRHSWAPLGVNRSCPPQPSTAYAYGWISARKPCRCVKNTPVDRATDHFRDGRALWPYAWVECEQSSASLAMPSVLASTVV